MTKVKKLLHLLATNLSGLTAAELMTGAGYPTVAQMCKGMQSARRRAARKGHAILRRPVPRMPGQTGRTQGKYVMRKIRRFENDTIIKENTPMTLLDMRNAHEAAFAHFKSLIRQKVKGATEYTWYRARAAFNGENVRRNTDTSHDFILAFDKEIENANNDYLAKLHAFFRARDGEHGVLGGKNI